MVIRSMIEGARWVLTIIAIFVMSSALILLETICGSEESDMEDKFDYWE
jgi:hypothetical protein